MYTHELFFLFIAGTVYLKSNCYGNCS